MPKQSVDQIIGLSSCRVFRWWASLNWGFRIQSNVAGRERVCQSITQERLAEIVALHPRTVQKIERGGTNILITTAIRLQRALRCRWENLFGKP